MKPLHDSHLSCIDCAAPLTTAVFIYSSSTFSLPLCIHCQLSFKEKSNTSTKETRELYIALRKRKVPAELEKWDGYKTIDIAIVHAKINIEVDGEQQHSYSRMELSDLTRTYYSFRNGYLTLRIPVSLVKYHLEETAEYITDFLRESRNPANLN